MAFSLSTQGVTATAREVWRLVKSDSIGVSSGYMATEAEDGDGTRLLASIDLYEISLTATPMHPGARLVSWKSATDELPTEADQRRRAASLMLTSEQERDLNRWLDAFNEPISEKASTPATRSGPIRVARFDA